MKILIATAVYYPQINGVAVFSHNLALGLAERGHEVLVLAPSLTGKHHVVQENGVKTVYLKSTKLKVYPDQVHPAVEKGGFYKNGFPAAIFPRKEVRRALAEFQPDVVHVQVSDPIGIAVVSEARKRKIPVVTTEHNEPEVIVESLKMPKIIKRGTAKGLKKFFVARQKKSDFVTMPTEKAIKNLISATKNFPVPIAAISNGVNLSGFRPLRVKRDMAPTAIYVGRIDPEKKVELVIRAFEKTLKEIPEAKLIIAGDGVDRVRLEKIVGEENLSGSVKFLGKVTGEELFKVYNLGDVFITASEIETQGIVLIEAAATGLPLIAVNRGAVSEICLDNRNGFLVEAGKVEALSLALTKILSNKELRARFSEKSREVAKEHDFEKTLDKFINIYRKLSDDIK
ncbi:glycosyltransferase [Candidatus Saccharibacteria bacterium]|nr:glycosyltransferase [Candidatus Saccharibacteria bacterium]